MTETELAQWKKKHRRARWVMLLVFLGAIAGIAVFINQLSPTGIVAKIQQDLPLPGRFSLPAPARNKAKVKQTTSRMEVQALRLPPMSGTFALGTFLPQGPPVQVATAVMHRSGVANYQVSLTVIDPIRGKYLKTFETLEWVGALVALPAPDRRDRIAYTGASGSNVLQAWPARDGNEHGTHVTPSSSGLGFTFVTNIAPWPGDPAGRTVYMDYIHGDSRILNMDNGTESILGPALVAALFPVTIADETHVLLLPSSGAPVLTDADGAIQKVFLAPELRYPNVLIAAEPEAGDIALLFHDEDNYLISSLVTDAIHRGSISEHAEFFEDARQLIRNNLRPVNMVPFRDKQGKVLGTAMALRNGDVVFYDAKLQLVDRMSFQIRDGARQQLTLQSDGGRGVLIIMPSYWMEGNEHTANGWLVTWPD